MSRSGYSTDNDDDQWGMIRWRGAVTSSIRGKRGQAFLRELVDAMDAMPEKRLISNYLAHGENVCAIGSVGLKRGIDMSKLDPDEPYTIADAFGIASALVQEIEYLNDEAYYGITPEERWGRMRDWAVRQIEEKSA